MKKLEILEITFRPSHLLSASELHIRCRVPLPHPTQA